MPFVRCLCQYCGHKFDEYLYNVEDVEKLYCPGCKDKNLTFTPKDEKSDVFGYNTNAPKKDAYIKKGR